ncbi:GEM-like protein 5 [Diospyros lotus]|uniref:GEM-like protein 5 n=1 Tax=Diospyros lotus TaxID=55363 RepID=UPI00224D7FB4|nr:GEM-like protein 5 [Diospyros lotus]
MASDAQESTSQYPSALSQPPPPSGQATPPPQYQTAEAEAGAGAGASSSSSSSSTSYQYHENSDSKWGTLVMGAPAVPTGKPGNQKAALWSAADVKPYYHHHPYLQYDPIDRTPTTSPMESILQKFNTQKAKGTARDIWHNLKLGPSVSGAAWDKVNLTAKAITGGGFESLFKQTFATFPNEKLKKTFACYLSTTTGPVAGTIYLSNVHVAFCSDQPLSFTGPSGQETWSYYKVMVPLGKIVTINPVVMRENPSEKYLQIVTVDGHDFWFMGFVNYEKATRHISESLGSFVAPGIAVERFAGNA